MKVRIICMFICIGVLLIGLGGCGCFMQAKKGETPPPPPPEEKKIVAPGENVVIEEKKEEIVVMSPPAAPPPAPALVLGDINFDFDRYAIRAGDAEILKKNLEWFKANSGQKVRIEGNCDERGTVEYNLALGQKRADAAKNFLVGLGVNASGLDTISYGKERPVCMEHNEACWAQNRRDHFEPMQK
jgi:peptidoglycan-associated lipoprotein